MPNPAAPAPAAAAAPAPAVPWFAPATATFSGVPPAAAQIGDAIANAPEVAADREAALEEAKAKASEAKQTQAVDQDRDLQRLINVAQADPKAWQNPVYHAAVAKALQSRGVTPPTNPDGSLNVPAIQNILTPAKRWADYSPKDIQAARQLPAALRPVIPDAPPEYATAPASIPMTPNEEQKIYDGLGAKEKLLGEGSYQPNVFLQDVLSARKRLEMAGMDTGAVDAYLSADHTQLSDGFKESVVGPKVQATMDHLHQLGIHLKDEDAYKAGLLKEKVREFDKTLKFKYYETDKKAMVSLTNAQNRLALGYQNLQARWASIQNSRNTVPLRVYNAMMGPMAKELQDARGDLTRTVATMQQMALNPAIHKEGSPESKAYQALADQAAAMDTFIKTNGPAIDAEVQAARTGVVRQYDQISGGSGGTQFKGADAGIGKMPAGAGSPTPAGTIPGKGPIWLNKAGTGYIYADGSPVK